MSVLRLRKFQSRTCDPFRSRCNAGMITIFGDKCVWKFSRNVYKSGTNQSWSNRAQIPIFSERSLFSDRHNLFAMNFRWQSHRDWHKLATYVSRRDSLEEWSSSWRFPYVCCSPVYLREQRELDADVCLAQMVRIFSFCPPQNALLLCNFRICLLRPAVNTI